MLFVVLLATVLAARLYIAHYHPKSAAGHHLGKDSQIARKSHNRKGSPVVVGFCHGEGDSGGESDRAGRFSSFSARRRILGKLVRAALPHRWIRWENMTSGGLPTQSERPFPDVVFCFAGQTFSQDAVQTRFDQPPEMGPPGGARSDDLGRWSGGVHRPDDWSFVRHRRGRPLLVGMNTDPWGSDDCGHLDALIDVKLAHPYNGCPSIYAPLALFQLLPAKGYDPEKLLTGGASSTPTTSFQKRKFCVLRCSQCQPHPMAGDGVVLWAFLHILEEDYQKCDIVGDCQMRGEEGVGGCQVDESDRAEKEFQESVELYSGYRFVVSFEPTQVDGYFSDTVVAASLAGAVPVFWGDERIGERVNPGRIINMNDYVAEDHVLKLRDAESIVGDERVVFAENFLRPEMAKAVKVLKSLNENEEKFTAVAAQPLVSSSGGESVGDESSGRKGSVLDPERIGVALNQLFHELESFTVA